MTVTMKKPIQEVDFLIIYEHKVRELENMCLIKYELERRGYTVEIGRASCRERV